jgi:hypothetical protein
VSDENPQHQWDKCPGLAACKAELRATHELIVSSEETRRREIDAASKQFSEAFGDLRRTFAMAVRELKEDATRALGIAKADTEKALDHGSENFRQVFDRLREIETTGIPTATRPISKRVDDVEKAVGGLQQRFATWRISIIVLVCTGVERVLEFFITGHFP